MSFVPLYAHRAHFNALPWTSINSYIIDGKVPFLTLSDYEKSLRLNSPHEEVITV